MKRLIFVSIIIAIIGACGAGDGEAVSADVSSSNDAGKPAKTEINTKKRNHKWEIAVEGLPEYSGSVVTAMGTPQAGIFTLASRQLTASISLAADTESPSSLIISFNDQNLRCMNYGAALREIDGSKVILSGELQCYEIDGDHEKLTKAEINGWFETEK